MKECAEDLEPVLTWQSEREREDAAFCNWLKVEKKQPRVLRLIRCYRRLEKRGEHFTRNSPPGLEFRLTCPIPSLRKSSHANICFVMAENFHHTHWRLLKLQADTLSSDTMKAKGQGNGCFKCFSPLKRHLKYLFPKIKYGSFKLQSVNSHRALQTSKRDSSNVCWLISVGNSACRVTLPWSQFKSDNLH